MINAEKAESLFDAEKKCRELCDYISGRKMPLPEDVYKFMGSEDCAMFIEDFFDDSVVRKMIAVINMPSTYSFKNWAICANHFIGNLSGDISEERLRESAARKSPYILLQLLVERQAIVTAQKGYSIDIAGISEFLYTLAPPQFSRIVKECADTDRYYMHLEHEVKAEIEK